MLNVDLKNYLVSVTALAVLFAGSLSGFAEEGGTVLVTGITVEEAVEEVFVEEEKEVDLSETFLLKLDKELSLSKTDYHQLLNRIEDTKKKIALLDEERVTLSSQIANLEGQKLITQERLTEVLREIVEKENTILTLNAQIGELEMAMEYQKEALRDYLRLIYTKERELFGGGGEEINAFRLLLSDDSVGGNLKQLEYFGLLNAAGQELVLKLMDLNEQLVLRRVYLAEDKEDLQGLRVALSMEREQLELQKSAHERLLMMTNGQEEVYASLLEESVAQQMEVVKDLSRLSEMRELARRSIEDGTFDYEAFVGRLDEKQGALLQFHMENYGKSVSRFIWPSDFSRGISAFFRNHGDGYQARFGMQHNAIDIRLLQGSPVYAAADAVVYAAVDNGYGYSYIILSHAGGFSTIYGHMYEMLVKPGQFVAQGAVIGLSGGMPGTRGAGYMTTGPHLHFEMKRNDIYVDPIDYLPLEVLKKDQLIEKYHAKWEEAVRRASRSVAR